MLNNDSVQPHFAYLQIPMPCLTLIYGSALQFFSGFINPDRSLWHALQTNSRRCWIVLNMEGFWSCRWIMSLVTGEWWRNQFKFTKPKPSIWKPVGTSPSFTLSRSRSASYCGEGKSRRSSGRTTATTKPSVPQFSVSGSFVRTSHWCWQTRRGPRHSIRIVIKILLSDSVFVKLNQDKPQTDCLGLTTPALVKSLLRLVPLCPTYICLVMILCKQS